MRNPEFKILKPKLPQNRKRFVVFGCALLLIMAAGCYGFHPQILTSLARAWVIDQPSESADAVVVLGGGLQYRTFEAARIYHGGLAPKVLIVRAKMNPTDALGLTQPEREIFRQVLLREGVPDEAIEAVGEDCTSTWEDAMAARDWMLVNGKKRLIVPTDIFHTRRTRWLMRQVFRRTDIQVSVRAITLEEYDVSNWWRHEEGLIQFQNEVIKFGFYLVKYAGGGRQRAAGGNAEPAAGR